MLKALELLGFKSFADKTRLEFPRGITVVVGPNGSGKSNIVDAIKWVLGEQSVKSLRGKEMADVIFNGSAGRRPLNAAEATLTFDNSERMLAIDAPEVHITRRVYRSGEGEYLINRQACRLRDIRELFAGTGVATEAYSVIEQGKVDVLLQASPRDRRLIFEEAAGISRFKAKKLEAERRLLRVEQNLLRLSDIVDEVDSRLRAVRAQATKARRYKEYAERLQQLRTQVGLADWRELTEKLTLLESELQSLQDEVGAAGAQADVLDARALELDVHIGSAEEAIRASEGRIAQNRERIATHESSIEHERRRQRDLEEEVARYRRQLTAMTVRAGGLEQQLAEILKEVESATAAQVDIRQRLATEERALTELTAQLDSARAENEQCRAAHLEKVRAAATLGNQISGLESRVAATQAGHERGARRLAELTTLRESLAGELLTLRAALEELSQENERRQAELTVLQTDLAERRQRYAQAQRELAELRERYTGASERAAVLEELEKRLEGVGAGVKEVLKQAKAQPKGPLADVRGLVADLLHVNVEHAALVEIALGESAQHVVVSASDALVEHLQQSTTKFAGRVAFIRQDALPPLTDAAQIDLRGLPGVVARADKLVETTSEFRGLARRLLGTTWFVETLAEALSLAENYGAGLSFVTRGGELLTAEGLLAVGPGQSSTGLISRRSELRALSEQLAQLQTRCEKSQADCGEQQQQITALETQAQQGAAELQAQTQSLASQRLKTGAVEERSVQIDQQHAAVTAELAAAEIERQKATTSLQETRGELVRIEATIGEMEGRERQSSARAMEIEQVRARRVRESGAAKIELAKSEQNLENLRVQQSQLQRDQQERGRALVEAQTQLELCGQRARLAERNILAAESEVAELYLSKEVFAGETVGHVNLREIHRTEKNQASQEVQRMRARARKSEAKLHTQQLAAGEVRHERTTLADRLREDYGIELAELEHQPTPEELSQREAVEQEISDLRSKINHIGGVNLDALDELEQLETRHAGLSAQHSDLSTAKASLEQIIGKINADSRRLFADTLEVVRGHFQTLFRKLFGGGHADIVLEEGADVLESGIEIVARPPGKEPRSISLLSGGEKTLTCVALLLAIFRSRPSPFCVLDEVDAALDEANIERFIGVLNEFLAWTQFIVVTHSKKTMTCASTLYGVTMQESGVSKRVSVRFEDVSDNGEIDRFSDDAATTEDGEGKDETQAA